MHEIEYSECESILSTGNRGMRESSIGVDMHTQCRMEGGGAAFLRELIFIPVLRMSTRFAEIRFLRSDSRLTQQYNIEQSIPWPYA